MAERLTLRALLADWMQPLRDPPEHPWQGRRPLSSHICHTNEEGELGQENSTNGCSGQPVPNELALFSLFYFLKEKKNSL